MRKIIAILITIVSIILGIYVGVYLLFIGGICQIVNGISPLNGMDIALGILRIMFSGLGGVIVQIGIGVAVAIGEG